MKSFLKERIHKKFASKDRSNIFHNEEGAIDLASIMVGIIVIGLIGGVIASTVFVVIPWAQDNAAKQQLDSVVQAENAYFGLSAATPSSLPAGYVTNSFSDSAGLANANLLQTSATYCVVTGTGSKSYQAYSASGSGSVWSVTDQNSQPVAFTGTLPASCQFILASATTSPSVTATATASPTATPTAYVDPAPTTLTMTFKCSTTVSTGSVPYSFLSGKETWNDGVTQTYTGNAGTPLTRSFTANVTYTMTFVGTFMSMNSQLNTATQAAIPCLRSVDHWGLNTGTTSAGSAFNGATNLTSVPANIPNTITSMSKMFVLASSFNQDLSSWDMSNVTDISGMFVNASAFNKPLLWNTSKVTTMYNMFNSAIAFNQDISNWDTTQVKDMSNMFSGATNFDQNIGGWNTANVTTMANMFYNTNKFSANLVNWNVAKVQSMRNMFLGNPIYNQDLHTWNTAALTSGTTFARTTYNTAYLPPKTSL